MRTINLINAPTSPHLIDLVIASNVDSAAAFSNHLSIPAVCDGGLFMGVPSIVYGASHISAV